MEDSPIVEQIKALATVHDAAAVCGFSLPRRGGKIKVPWRSDNKPSASVTADGKRIVDWSQDERGQDALGVIGLVKDVSFPVACNLLGCHLGLGEPFPDASGWGSSRLIFSGGASDYEEPPEPAVEPVIESAGIANFTTVADKAADAWLRSLCEHLANCLELAVMIAEWRGLPVQVIVALAKAFRLGSDGKSVWMPCKTYEGLLVRAQVRKIGPRSSDPDCEYFWPRERDFRHKPEPWKACENGQRVIVAEGWGDAAAVLAVTGGKDETIIATLGTGVRKLEGIVAGEAYLLRQHDRGDANARWARSIRALWPTISVKSLIPPSGVKDWADVVKQYGVEGARPLLESARRVDDDPVPAESPEMAGRKYQNLNDSLAGEVFIEVCGGNFLHDDTLSRDGEWYKWEKTHWRAGAGKMAVEMAKRVQDTIREEALREARRHRNGNNGGDGGRRAQRSTSEIMLAFAHNCGNSRSIANMMKLASSEPAMSANFAHVRTDPFLLPCQNGVFDLRGDGFRDARREDMITRRIDVSFDEEAACPLWLHTLDAIFEGDSERIGFLQRWFGYVLTGCTHEQKLLFLYGAGSNGKSTICEILKAMMGELGVSVPQMMIIADKSGNDVPGHEMIRLRGSRLALAPEIDKNAKLAEARVKTLTGGDTMRGRDHYEKSVDFTASHKLVFFGNHKPSVHGGDDGIWRRFILLHLRRKFEGAAKDLRLKDKLMMELPGILNWSIAGCFEWQMMGLRVPASVDAELIDYRESNDWLGTFMAENVQSIVGFTIKLKDLREKIISWAKETGETWIAESISIQRLRRELEDKGWKVERDRNRMPFIQGMWSGEKSNELLED